MCGIFALMGPDSQGLDPESVIRSLRHRGPDGQGYWRDTDAGVLLVHTRLAIVDPTEAGAQPMVSPSGRYVTSFNGEIYNHLALRQALEAEAGNGVGFSWRGHSDIETFLACVDAWGLRRTLENAIGMFAFALWDRETRQLHVARDRFGEKPLHVGRVGDNIVVASEIQAFALVPGFAREVDPRALDAMLRFLAVPAPMSIYRGINMLPPAHQLRISRDAIHSFEPGDAEPYWRIPEPGDAAAQVATAQDDQQAIETLDRLFTSAVERQLISDVPLGAFLSGGIDSSLVVAVMQKIAATRSAPPVQTFTIGFERADYDESPHARRVAAELHTQHTELMVTDRECLDLIPDLAGVYDQPFADASQLGVTLLSRLTSQSVTVALSGDGADELFGGYNRYVQGPIWWGRLAGLPMPLKSALASALVRVSPSLLDELALGVAKLLPASHRVLRPGERLEKLARLLRATSGRALYGQLVEHWSEPPLLGRKSDDPASSLWPWLDTPLLADQMMHADLAFILPTDMLAKVDRAGMNASLETRMPFLDPDVASFAIAQPLHRKIRDGRNKWLLRALLGRYLPQELIDRPKMGFNSPIAHWLRGPLRDWAEALLNEHRLRREGIFDAGQIRNCWQQHLNGRRDHALRLWAVLMFQAWYENRSSGFKGICHCGTPADRHQRPIDRLVLSSTSLDRYFSPVQRSGEIPMRSILRAKPIVPMSCALMLSVASYGLWR
ncbi:MAG: asparagine synthase (glutamine-hydrolyzing) [Burkholderiaceae bacterium]